jgi:hypothetical protein
MLLLLPPPLAMTIVESFAAGNEPSIYVFVVIVNDVIVFRHEQPHSRSAYAVRHTKCVTSVIVNPILRV